MFATTNQLPLPDQLALKAYAFLVEKKAGSDAFAAQAVLLLVVAALASVMMLARSAIGAKILEAIAAIAG
jgi:hypothetical protein